MVILRVFDAGDWKDIDESGFPLGIGVSPEGELTFSSSPEEPAAWLGFNNHQLFFQPAGAEVHVQINAEEIDGAQWLVEKDTIQIDSAACKLIVDSNVFVLSPAVAAAAASPAPPETPRTGPQKASQVNPPRNHRTSSGPALATKPSFARIKTGRISRRLRNAIIICFVLLLLSVVFVLTAVPVRVTITPTPDTTSLSRFPLSIKVWERYLIVPGTYHVYAEKKGYRKLDESITVGFGSDSTFNYTLRKLPGLLDVATQPIEGAEVLIDDTVVGKTPLDSFEVEEGQHELNIKAQRYIPHLQLIAIQGMGIRQHIDVMLQPGWGTLHIKSSPDGADVLLKGTVVGQTPLTIEPMGGVCEIGLSKEGWRPIVHSVTVTPGETIDLPLFELQKLKPGEAAQALPFKSQGSEVLLELTSSPSGARIMLNNEFRGHTPLSLAVLPGTDHQLVVSKSGFATATRSVNLQKSSESIDVQLKPEYGVVFINCQPVDALLKVDGKILGAASRRLKLTTRPHRLEISKAGYDTFKTTLTPLAGVSKKLEVQLKGTRSVAKAPASSALTTAEGQVLHTIRVRQPITFQMGASRRESGRRSNERLYQVEFTRTFNISEKEVTNAEFRKFRPGHTSGQAQGLDLNANNQPVTSVTWNDATAYMNWLSKKEGLPPAYREKSGTMVAVVPLTTGYRLPTEAEWEFVARYAGSNRADGQPMKYPWGNERYPSNKNGNYADSSASGIVPLTMKNYTDGYSTAAPVGTFPANAVEMYDLGGNVSEWCHDYYDVYSGAPTKVLRDPSGPARGKYHVVRGSSWRHGSITELRLSYRDYTDKARDDLGFRIARYEKK